MKIGIIGSGAIGLYYGARLQRIGQEVHFLARTDFESIRKNGIQIRAGDGDFTLNPVNVHKSSETIGVCDLVIVAMKATSNHAVESLTRPLVGEATTLLTFQNGLSNDRFLTGLFPGHRVLNGLCFICLNRVDPGVVDCFILGSISIGEFKAKASLFTQQLKDIFNEAGMNCSVYDDLQLAQWKKLVWNVPFNGLTIAGGGITTQDILEDSGLSQLVLDLMNEIREGAAALGMSISSDFPQEQIEKTRGMGPYKPSSVIDFLQKKPVEVEAIWGEPLRQAQAAGVRVPKLEMLYHLLRITCSGDRLARA